MREAGTKVVAVDDESRAMHDPRKSTRNIPQTAAFATQARLQRWTTEGDELSQGGVERWSQPPVLIRRLSRCGSRAHGVS